MKLGAILNTIFNRKGNAEEADLYRRYKDKTIQALSSGLSPDAIPTNPSRQETYNFLGKDAPQGKLSAIAGKVSNAAYDLFHPKQPLKSPIPQVEANTVNTMNKILQRTRDKVDPGNPTPTPMDSEPTWEDLMVFFAKQAAKGGYHRGAIVSQKAVESDRGRHEFAKTRNNFGGIGAYDSDPNQAFSFASPEDYWNYYDLMIQKRFPDAYAVRNDPLQYLQNLKKGNYATDKDYVWKVMNTPEYRNYDY